MSEAISSFPRSLQAFKALLIARTNVKYKLKGSSCKDGIPTKILWQNKEMLSFILCLYIWILSYKHILTNVNRGVCLQSVMMI